MYFSVIRRMKACQVRESHHSNAKRANRTLYLWMSCLPWTWTKSTRSNRSANTEYEYFHLENTLLITLLRWKKLLCSILLPKWIHVKFFVLSFEKAITWKIRIHCSEIHYSFGYCIGFNRHVFCVWNRF